MSLTDQIPDHSSPTEHMDTSSNASLKRKRSPDTNDNSPAHAPPPPPQPSSANSTRPSNHLAINYLARHLTEDVPLVSADDSLPNILSILGEYSGILERHESLALNLGAKPLGPIIMRRFEKLFEGPPVVIQGPPASSNGAGAETPIPRITWLDVVEFAPNHLDQFVISELPDGARVCQFTTKQCRVQISEEDYQLIASGIPQKLIPPQPVAEDEEKEIGTLEILEQSLSSLVQTTDTVAAKGRQLRHRIVARKSAILERRAADPGHQAARSSSPSNIALMNGGFTAVNSRPQEINGINNPTADPRLGASEATKTELRKQFSAVKSLKITTLDSTNGQFTPKSASGNQRDELAGFKPNSTPTPTVTASKDDTPYRAEIMSRVEATKRGDRLQPPCDRCRRLRMDCLKNLTACYGCTRKHAKCSWKDVKPNELAPLPSSLSDSAAAVAEAAAAVDPDTDAALEQLRRAVHEEPPVPGSQTQSTTQLLGNNTTASSSEIFMSGSSDTAAEGLTAVAKASTAHLESADEGATQYNSQKHPITPIVGQSPNMGHASVSNPNHQSPNINNNGYNGFDGNHQGHNSPHQHHQTQQQQHSHHAQSVNMPYANISSGRRLSDEAERTNGESKSEAEYVS